MVSNSLETKRKARQHIVNAMKVVQYMNPEEAGDYPERQREYKLEIRKAKQLLRKVYSPNNVIFDELDLNTHIGLMASLGTLNIGDEPFIDYKRDTKAAETFNAETFNADSKEEARLKKYEKTYGKEGAKVRNRIFKRIIAKADWGTKANQWSARKAQALTDEYEEAMKGKGKKAYKTSKRTKTQKSLKKWGDQKWKTKSGQDSSKTGERYLPEKAIKALTDKEYKKTSDKKRQDTKKGKQFSDQPKGVAKKVAKYRAETFEAEGKVGKNKWLQAIYDAIYDENDPSYKIMYHQQGQYGYPISTSSSLIEISMTQKALAEGKKPPTERQVKNGMLKSINEASGKKMNPKGAKNYGVTTKASYEYNGKRFFVRYTVQKPLRGSKEPYELEINGEEYFENPMMNTSKDDYLQEYEAETKISKTCPNCEKYGRDATTDYICDMCAQCKGCCETSYGCYDVAICNDCDGSFIGKDIDGCCGSCDDCCECDQDPSMNAESKSMNSYLLGAGIFALTLGLLSRKR